MEKLFMRYLLPPKKLDVVYDQQVDLPVKQRELAHAVVLNGLDELRRKPFARNIEHRLGSSVLFNVVADRLNEVRFAQAHPAVNQKRVKTGGARLLRNRPGGAACEAVTVAFNKTIEDVRRVELTINLRLANARDSKGMRTAYGRAPRRCVKRLLLSRDTCRLIVDIHTGPARRDVHRCSFITRSEEHTSELQSRGHLVCRLLLEKK